MTEIIDFEKIKDRALNLLARRDHSAFELRAKLRQKLKIENDVFEELLVYLKKLGYMVPEQDLTQRWIAEWRKEGRGRHWISNKLKTKGLPQGQLSDDEEEEASGRYFVEKKLRGKSLDSLSYEDKGRLGRSLVSRGFSHSIVAKLIK